MVSCCANDKPKNYAAHAWQHSTLGLIELFSPSVKELQLYLTFVVRLLMVGLYLHTDIFLSAHARRWSSGIKRRHRCCRRRSSWSRPDSRTQLPGSTSTHPTPVSRVWLDSRISAWTGWIGCGISTPPDSVANVRSCSTPYGSCCCCSTTPARPSSGCSRQRKRKWSSNVSTDVEFQPFQPCRRIALPVWCNRYSVGSVAAKSTGDPSTTASSSSCTASTRSCSRESQRSCHDSCNIWSRCTPAPDGSFPRWRACFTPPTAASAPSSSPPPSQRGGKRSATSITRSPRPTSASPTTAS